jgi:hypothetical protein
MRRFGKGKRSCENAAFAQVSLTFEPCGGLSAPLHRKEFLFDPPPGPKRPEANARQRDAPSGAKVFGISFRRDAETQLAVITRESGVIQ